MTDTTTPQGYGIDLASGPDKTMLTLMVDGRLDHADASTPWGKAVVQLLAERDAANARADAARDAALVEAADTLEVQALDAEAQAKRFRGGSDPWADRTARSRALHNSAAAILALRDKPAPFPAPSDRTGKEPCGECRLRPGETCDICNAYMPAHVAHHEMHAADAMRLLRDKPAPGVTVQDHAKALLVYLSETQDSIVWETTEDAMAVPMADPGDVIFAALRAIAGGGHE